MNVSPVSFTGKYIISGSRQELNKVESILMETRSSKCREMDSIRFASDEKNKYYQLFVTNNDCSIMQDAEADKNLMAIFSKTNGDVLKKLRTLALNIFGSKDNINVYEASALIERHQKTKPGSQRIPGFNSLKGILKGGSALNLDGKTVEYYPNGKLKFEGFHDGAYSKYDPCGHLVEQRNSDGTMRYYSYNGLKEMPIYEPLTPYGDILEEPNLFGEVFDNHDVRFEDKMYSSAAPNPIAEFFPDRSIHNLFARNASPIIDADKF